MSVQNELISLRRNQGDTLPHRIFIVIVSLVLFGVTALVYWPACANGFVEWDDQFYVYEQPRILRGICLDGIGWALTANVAGNWHPMTLISLQLDAQLFGPDPFGFHRTAVLMHALNSVLAFVTLLVLTGCRWRSVICGFLFALHPMRVESVAWISERKDLLSGTFFFLTILGYVWYVRSPSVARYLLALVFLALGLSSKPMLVTTPCVLLLLDYWPLGRCRGFGTGDRRTCLNLICEKLPMFALSMFASIITLLYQQGAMQILGELSPGIRLSNAAVSYMAYLSQTFWPVGLSPIYLHQEIYLWHLCMAAAVLGIVTGMAIWQRKKRPYLLVGWLLFVGMLIPVTGTIQAGIQARADRYMYLAQMGIYLAVVWGVSDFVEHTKFGRVVTAVFATLFITGCGYATIQQIPVWRDSESMWSQAIRVDSSNQFALYHLTWWYIGEGKHDEAIRVLTNAAPIRNETEFKMLAPLIGLLADRGELETVIAAVGRALKFHDGIAELYEYRGKAFAGLGRWREATDDYRRACTLSPQSVSYQFYLAHAVSRMGEQQAAEAIYAAAIRQAPEWPRIAAQLAWKMSTNPDPDSRIKFWPVQLAEQANEATGARNPEFLDVLAAAYAEAGQFNDAVTTAERAIQTAVEMRQPDFAAAIGKRRELYLAQKPYRESPSR